MDPTNTRTIELRAWRTLALVELLVLAVYALAIVTVRQEIRWEREAIFGSGAARAPGAGGEGRRMDAAAGLEDGADGARRRREGDVGRAGGLVR